MAAGRVAALTVAAVLCAGLAGCGGSGPGAASRSTTTSTCTSVTPNKKCPSGQTPASGFVTNTVWQRTPLAIREGCQHLDQLARQVSEALDSTNAKGRLRSATSGTAWNAVSGMGSVGLSGQYKQFAMDVTVLNLGIAAWLAGGPSTSLRDALSKLSADCRSVGQPLHS